MGGGCLESMAEEGWVSGRRVVLESGVVQWEMGEAVDPVVILFHGPNSPTLTHHPFFPPYSH